MPLIVIQTLAEFDCQTCLRRLPQHPFTAIASNPTCVAYIAYLETYMSVNEVKRLLDVSYEDGPGVSGSKLSRRVEL